MKQINTILGAFIAALIGFLSGMLALIADKNIVEMSDIGEISWVVLGVGALIAFLKDFQAITTRRAIGRVTGSKDE